MEPIFKNDNTQITLSPDGGILFVDHEKNNRSGHFGHAMVQCENGDVLCFYPNCNTDGHGHSARGTSAVQTAERRFLRQNRSRIPRTSMI